MSKAREFLRKFDPVSFEIMKNALISICTEASEYMRRVAFSVVITEAKDSSVALHTSDGRMVAVGEGDAAPHYGSFEHRVRSTIDWIGLDAMRPGDAYLCNDPWLGGTHKNDVGLVRPIFRNDNVYAFAVTMAHWADVGGSYPGSFDALATEHFAEGLTIPPVKAFENDKFLKPILDIIHFNVRIPEQITGDIYGQFHSARYVENQVNKLAEKWGEAKLNDAMEELMNYTETVFRNDVEKLPEGVYECVDWGDMDFGRSGQASHQGPC